jgi:hypothetical protein
MAIQYPSVPYYLAASAFWEQFGMFVLAAALTWAAVLLHKRRKKPTAEEAPVRVYRPRFNQRSGTAFGELKPNPVRRYASCHCLDGQYEPIEEEEASEEEQCLHPEWQELSFHAEVQDTDADAWKSLEAYIAKIREEGSNTEIRQSVEPVREPPCANPARDRRHDESRRVRSVYVALPALVSVRDYEVRATGSKPRQHAVSLRQL